MGGRIFDIISHFVMNRHFPTIVLCEKKRMGFIEEYIRLRRKETAVTFYCLKPISHSFSPLILTHAK